MKARSTLRRIVDVERHARRAVLKMDCGHHRSIGANVFHGGRVVGRALIGTSRLCYDGACGSYR